MGRYIGSLVLSLLVFSCQLQNDEAFSSLSTATAEGEYLITTLSEDGYTFTVTVERDAVPVISHMVFQFYTCDGLDDLSFSNLASATVNGQDWLNPLKVATTLDEADDCYGILNDPIMKFAGLDELEPEPGQTEVLVYTIVLTFDTRSSGGFFLIKPAQEDTFGGGCLGYDPESGYDNNHFIDYDCSANPDEDSDADGDGDGDDGDGDGDDGNGDEDGDSDSDGDSGSDGDEDSDPQVCYEYNEETAWAAGNRYVAKGNWATYTPYAGETIEVAILAGQHHAAGAARIEPDGENHVRITITLAEGWYLQEGGETIKIQPYYGEQGPKGNPAPGQFEYKSNSFDPFVLPKADYYGIHLDVRQQVEVDCPGE